MKKSFKKAAVLLLALVLLCGLIPAASAANADVSPTYTITATDEVDGVAQLTAGQTVTLRITVSGAAFNGMKAVLKYDETLLSLTKATGAAVTNFPNDGQVELYTLKKDAYPSGSEIAVLEFTAAAVDTKQEADFTFAEGATVGDYTAFRAHDAKAAACLGDAVKVRPYSVIMPTDLFTGRTTVKHGNTYYFHASAEGEYSYGAPEATMGGVSAVVETDDSIVNAWLIRNVTGDIIIADPRGAQEYPVRFSADDGIPDVPANGTARGGEDYTFAVPTMAGYKIGVEVTIGGADFVVAIVDGQVTLPGEAIVGEIVVTFTKTADHSCLGGEHVFEAAPTYTWSADNTTCTAEVICSCGETSVSATVPSTAVESETATTYTAQFDNPLFTTQTKTVVKESGGDTEDKKQITVSFRLIGDSIHANGAQDHKKYVTWIPTTYYTVDEGTSAFEVFRMALAENGLGHRSVGSYKIGSVQAPAVLGGFWLSNQDNDINAGWMYAVNGSHPQMGIDVYALAGGEEIIVHYCDDFLEEENPSSPYYQRWLEAPDVAPSAEDKDDETDDDEEEPEASVVLKPEASVSGGKATANVGTGDVNSALEEAKKDETVGGVTIAPTVKGNVDEIAVTIPKNAVGTVADSGFSLSVETEIADVKLPNKALQDVASRTGNTVAVTVGKMAGDAVSVEVSIDGKAIQNIDNGIVVTVPTEDVDKVLVIVGEDGTETVIKKSAAVAGGVSALIEGSATVKLVEGKNKFNDIAAHWGKNSIEFAANRELFFGVADGVFAPNITTTRAMLVTVLYRLEGEPEHDGHDHGFDDVAHDQWYSDAVAWAEDCDIVAGYSDTVFDPHGEITREQMAAIIHRYAQYLEMSTHHKGDLSKFDDHHETSDWARESKEWAVGAGIIAGKDNNRLDPIGDATRAEVAAVLQRLIKLMLK